MEIQRTEQRLLYEIAGTPHSYRAWVLVLTVLILSGCEKKEAASPPGPPEVQVVEVSKQDVPIYSDWVAQLNGDVNAEIVPKVQGYVLNRNYDEGGFVQKGQLLFEIDPRPFQAALEQTKAQLANAEAELSKADKDLARDAPLVAQEAIPRKQLDNDKAALATAEAQVGAAQAQVAQAELNLNWTKVHSPIDGIAGTANAQVGDLVGPTTKMTTISTVDPIRAYFSVSEDVYLQYSDRIRAVVRGIPKAQPLTVEYIDATGSRYPKKVALSS